MKRISQKQRIVCSLFFLLVVGPLTLMAQNRTVIGRVVDSVSKAPLVGASILLKGSPKGTATSSAGTFRLEVPAGGTLIISSTGYRMQEITPVTSDSLIVQLSPANQQLNDVVVVGYGTQKRATLTGSISTVSAKDFENKGSLASPLQALQGQVPGVIITRSSSAPGDESWAVNIRGAVSTNSTEPLVILDGVAMGSYRDLRNINPSDIESISFLKDAAAAIYGSRAAGGVMLVTTKKGAAGKAKVEYDPTYTDNIVGLQPHLMNIKQWATGLIEARKNDGYGSSDTWIQYATLALANVGKYIDLSKQANPIPGNFSDVNDYVFLDNDWTKILWGNAPSTQQNLSISGGTAKSTYNLSFGYYYDGGTFKWGDNSNKRYNVRLNNTFHVSDKFTVNSIISYNRQNQVKPSNQSFLGESYAQPGLPYETLNGKPYGWGGQYDVNWEAKLGGDNKLLVSQTSVSENFTYDITKDLKAVANLGYNTSVARRDIQYNSIEWYNYTGTTMYATYPTQSSSNFQKTTSIEDYYNATAYLAYNKTFNGIHNVALTLGTQYERDEYDQQMGQVYDINSSYSVLKGNGKLVNNESKNHYAMGSYYGRFNYAYKSKYLLEVNGRYDGSSKFAAVNRWNFFYGVSAGWRISQEDFFKNTDALKFINELKLTASYGIVGNQSGIDLYDGIMLLNENPGTGPYLGSGLTSTVTQSGTLVSYTRTWERISNYNVALNFIMLNNRLSGTAEWFQKHNNNMLLSATYSGVLGIAAPQTNTGTFRDWGWDGNLNWTDKIGKVQYNIGGDITYAQNKLVNYGSSNIPGAGINGAAQGYPLNVVLGYRYAGRIQTQAQLDQYYNKFYATSALSSPMPGKGVLSLGDNMYQDVNGDGKLTTADMVNLGSNDPKLSFAFNFGLNYAGFDFSMIFQGAGKRAIARNSLTWGIPFRSTYLNTTTISVNKEWTPTRTDAFYPRYSTNSTVNSYNYMPSTWSVQNGAYLRLKNVVLGYTLPQSVIKKTKAFTSARVYVAGADLWEITHIHDGWDPEATQTISTYERYPFVRTVTVGLNLNF